MQSLHSAITPPAPPTPRQLSKSPTSRQVEKPTSRKVGKLANTAPFLFTLYPLSPPESRSAAKRPILPPLLPLPLTPPVDLTRPTPPHPAAPLPDLRPPTRTDHTNHRPRSHTHNVHTSSHPHLLLLPPDLPNPALTWSVHHTPHPALEPRAYRSHLITPTPSLLLPRRVNQKPAALLLTSATQPWHPAPLQLSNFPTNRKVEKSTSWQTPPPSPAPPTRAGCLSFLFLPPGRPPPSSPVPAAVSFRFITPPPAALPPGKPRNHLLHHRILPPLRSPRPSSLTPG